MRILVQPVLNNLSKELVKVVPTIAG